jgi:hypothetical protein
MSVQKPKKEAIVTKRKVVAKQPEKGIDRTPPVVATGKCENVEKTGWGKNWLVTMAYELSGCDKEFLYMIEGENGNWDIKERSRVVQDGKREDSWGLCQLNRQWHSKVVDDPRYKTDPKFQIESCYTKFKGGTKFYGYPSPKGDKERRRKIQEHFIFYP